METARKYFPAAELYMCTGGDAVAWHAAEFAAQCKACASVGGGVRITNEASNYGNNFTVTNWVSSAGAYYGAYYSFEPAGQVTERGAVCRIYNAAATDAKGLHYYSSNVLGAKDKCENFIKNIGAYKTAPIKREIAYLYPDTPMVLDPSRRGENSAVCTLLRDYADYMFACDLTIADGILGADGGVKALIIAVDGCYRAKTLMAIRDFVSRGGLLVGINLRELKALEDDRDWMPELFGGGNALLLSAGKMGHGKPTGTLSVFEFDAGSPEKIEELQKNVFDPVTEFLAAHGVSVPDGKIDGIYVASRENGLLALDYTGSPEPKERELVLPDGTTRTISTVDSTIYEIC
jgi:hypothetical protein